MRAKSTKNPPKRVLGRCGRITALVRSGEAHHRTGLDGEFLRHTREPARTFLCLSYDASWASNPGS
jgi:hypothetical protein